MYRWLTAVLCVVLPYVHAADWQLNPQRSSLYAVSIKSQNIAEAHHFQIETATLKDDVRFAMSIALATVDSGLEQRDGLLRSVLFEVSKYPKVDLTASITTQWLSALEVASPRVLDVDATLSLHGITQRLRLSLTIVKLSPSRLLVVPYRPVVLALDDFELSSGLKKLAKISQLDDIFSVVPINFVLSLERTE
ncbi:YceI family protein [Shewanella avicenniae]|uniref:YceI family protein n=1 Tax=Shewanella avicenniae TaxID=2814294 RepID=A0ABX7QMY4_9GAMM|nr:YceI family protein [Shewanella avicenniae]QSX32076.1 YceI family protein [Shewanella avicenniae]